MIRPVLQDDAFLDSVRETAPDMENLHLWWLGQSGFLVQWQGRHLLLDPYLSDSLTLKYAATDKPHVRMTEIVVDPERLNFIDLVTSSHAHTDHLDKETLVPLFRANPKLELICPEAIRDVVVDRLGLMSEAPRVMNAGQSLHAKGFRFHAVPAAHNELETDAWGRHIFLGYVIEAGPWRIYHSGDTTWYTEIVPNVQRWQVHLALLPINGDHPARRVAGNLSGAEAAALAKQIGAELVIPCHYDMFEFNTASPAEFVAECKRLHQAYSVLRCGERWSSAELAKR
ncbi:MAG TPA: MBL fold metallo-hydrolase [Candidatus Binatia bacterium]|nr:MBL fold metallo-hydrolase [Candidatus Binatia bacterium]